MVGSRSGVWWERWLAVEVVAVVGVVCVRSVVGVRPVVDVPFSFIPCLRHLYICRVSHYWKTRGGLY